ncbi:hypothetical protein DVH24_012759 [Malus domestica]|uniref:Uncharacterized protein n=1 Tax=Malus domestica TaxID=3750 RepID=A0A498HU23_MALDO|nr:hypothetical protein DVH24_012759 [Malus domestica]
MYIVFTDPVEHTLHTYVAKNKGNLIDRDTEEATKEINKIYIVYTYDAVKWLKYLQKEHNREHENLNICGEWKRPSWPIIHGPTPGRSQNQPLSTPDIDVFVGIEEIHPIQKPETARESGIELHHYFASPSSLSVSVMSSTSALSSRLSNFHRLTDSQDHLSFREGVNSRPACPSIVSWPGIKTGRTPRSSRVYGLFGGGKKGNNERGDDAASKGSRKATYHLMTEVEALNWSCAIRFPIDHRSIYLLKADCVYKLENDQYIVFTDPVEDTLHSYVKKNEKNLLDPNTGEAT